MNIRPQHYALLSACIATALLSACGGGGGGGMVRPTVTAPPPSPPPPPPPPPPRSLQLPAAPPLKATPVAPPHDATSSSDFATRLADYRTALGAGFSYDAASGSYVVSTAAPNGYSLFARTPGSLVKQGDGSLQVNGRFDGGIRVASGHVSFYTDAVHADLAIERGASVDLYWGDIVGDVDNDGQLIIQDWDGFYYDIYTDLDVFGDYDQSIDGLLAVYFGSQGNTDVRPKLTIAGVATLDGTLELRPSGYIPTAGYLDWILHAHGGVNGQFARWTSPGLLIDGNLRYDAKNVWLEVSRASMQAAMANQGADRITLASAANLDRALAGADLFASLPSSSRSRTQSRFLESAAHLLWLDDAGQATRSLESLAGSLHADAMQDLASEDMLARGVGQRMLGMQAGGPAGAWSLLHGDARIAGADQWLTPQLLLGASATEATGRAADAAGGLARHQSPQAALYLRWLGTTGWYAGGSIGHARHALAFDRQIDLADGGRWNTHAQRRLGISSLDVEAGRTLTFAHSTLAPYVWLGADVIRSERALEQGLTGFELALQATTQATLDAGVGLRASRRWTFGDSAWMRMDADARYRQRLAHAGDPLRAAFIGVPDVWFDVPGHARGHSTWLDLGLRGGFGRNWGWSLGHSGSLAGEQADRRWRFGLQRRF